MSQLAHEKVLFRYISALERGDFETVAAVLHQAELDTELERMIIEMNEALGDEYESTVQEETAQLVRQIIETHLPSGLYSLEDGSEVPPITLSDIANRLVSNTLLQPQIRKEAQSLALQLSQAEAPLPEKFNQRTLATLLEQFGLSVSNSCKKLFHETAVLLSMGREQNLAQLAATRRQQKLTGKKNEEGETKE